MGVGNEQYSNSNCALDSSFVQIMIPKWLSLILGVLSILIELLLTRYSFHEVVVPCEAQPLWNFSNSA